MNKKLSKELLLKQIDKLGKPQFQTNEIWINKTSSLIKDFFGDNSEEYKFITRFQYKKELITAGAIGRLVITNTKEVTQFLNDCMDTLDHKGLYRELRTNFVMRLDNGTLVALIFGLLAILGPTCFAWGKYSSDLQNIELKQQVKAQQDSIKTLRIRSLSKTKKT
jgi:hypothetical protein